ncbi:MULTISPECIES: acyltransferase family protein [Pseudomonas]|nr:MULTISPECIES: acyltransferase [Pseudomonas]MDM8190895.1 acyltransferase [Pseudomonas fluorescens]MDP8572140.1 acyltransferase [Pseudomonas iranensis]
MYKTKMDRIVFLDYTRILAFISVLVGHKFIVPLIITMGDTSQHASIRLLANIAYQICYGGAAGIIIFFLTSGYIISHVLQSETSTEFIIKRIFRIYPLFMFAVVLEAVLNRYVLGLPFADISDWIPRLLLLGDYFGTRPVIGSVEWTLRIEVTFYALMVVLKACGLMRHQNYLPAVFILITLALHFLPAFPSAPGLAYGYFTVYAPFLFIGVCIYLIEHRRANNNVCLLTIAIIMYSFFLKAVTIVPDWKELNYGLFAVMAFSLFWLLRRHLTDGPFIRLLSTLTYSVYLFHNWFWTYIEMALKSMGMQENYLKMATVTVLFLFCYGVNKTVEDYGLKMGRKVLQWHRSRQLNTSVKATA